MDITVRVALCQMECHPAIIVGDHDYLKEPFLPQRNVPTLCDLSRHALDLTSFQDECAQQYSEWHSRRLQHVLDWIASVSPLPDIIVFPECSIPIHDLHAVRAFALQHDATVFAGTHTLRLNDEDQSHYDGVGIERKSRRNWNARTGGRVVLPILGPDRSIAHVKAVPSVFEHTDTTQLANGLSLLQPIVLTVQGQRVRVLPAVCAEAIQLNAPAASYDLVVILAHNDGVAPFLPTIAHNVQNQVPVVFCNDGHYGGSSVNVVIDQRMTDIWWWSKPLEGRLPPGDAILVVDIHLNNRAAQVGVTNPEPSAHLAAVVPVVADHAVSSSLSVAQELEEIAKQSDNAVQYQLLEGCLQQPGLSPMQRTLLLQLKRLAAAGNATSEWWQLIGRSCYLHSMPDLAGLERSLAEQCADVVDTVMASSATDSESVLGKLAKLKRECLARAGRARDPAGNQDQVDHRATDTPLDREHETRDIREFLEHKTQRVLFVTGLDDVGKETLVSLALAQVGCSTKIWIDLGADATLAFIGTSLAKHLRIPNDTNGVDELQTLADTHVIDRIPLGTVVVLSHVDNLKSHGQWREPGAPAALSQLAQELAGRRSKLVLISSARVDCEGLEPATTRRIYVKGLPEEYALVLFDRHLRRAGLDPTNYDREKRTRLVKDLGCHPGAIVLASEYVDQDGFDPVAEDLRKRSGVHTQIVRRILKRLSFTEEQLMVLSLLGEVRSAIPPSTIAKAVSFAAVPVAQGLVQQSVVERRQHDHLALTDLVRGYADLPTVPPPTFTLFHKAAAEAFAVLAKDIREPQQLVWAIESRYHAHLAGDPNLAPRGGRLVDGIIGAAYRLVERHEYERAKPIIDQLLKTERRAEVFQLGALVHARLGHCEDALALAREAFSADTNRSWIVTEVGKLSLHVHRTDIAKECVSLVRRTGHDSPYLATLQGRILLRESDEPGAIEAFRRAVQLAESEERRQGAWPHFFLGRALLKAGKIEEAIDVLYRGEELLSDLRRPKRDLLIAIRTQLAIAYVYDGQLESARALFELITSEDAGSPEVIWAFALYRAAAGETGDGDALARETLRELNASRARDRYGRCQVYLFRAMIYLGIGNRERASEEFSRAHREDPRNVFVILRWADTLIKLARDSQSEGEHPAARICAEHVKSLAEKILEFDKGNEQARQILETLSDEFNVL